jgi:hypothetical protein
VHDVGAQPAEDLVELGKLPDALPWWLVQGNELYIGALNALFKVGNLGQCQHHVPKRGGRHVIDQVDHTIFKPAGIKPVHHVDDHGAGIRRHGGCKRRAS